MSLKNWSILLFLSLIWGGSFFFNAVLVRELGPLTIAFGRTLIASIILIAVVYSRGLKMPSDFRLWGALAMMGFLNNLIPFSLIAWGQKSIDSGLASILNATMPVWAVLLAHLVTDDEKLKWNKAVGVALGLAGVVVLIGPEALRGLGSQVYAQLAVVGAAMSYAVAAIFGRRFRGLPPLVLAAGMLTCTAVLSLPIALVVERFWEIRPMPQTWFALLGLAILSTAFAYILYFYLLGEVGASNLSLVTLLIPASAVLLGFLFLDEQLNVSLLGGMGLIGSGLAAIDGRILALRRDSDRKP